jgi:hypothetical protein
MQLILQAFSDTQGFGPVCQSSKYSLSVGRMVVGVGIVKEVSVCWFMVDSVNQLALRFTADVSIEVRKMSSP